MNSQLIIVVSKFRIMNSEICMDSYEYIIQNYEFISMHLKL